MANPIDLCQLSDVRAWLGLNPTTQAAAVSTTVAASIAVGNNVVATPASMANILKGTVLTVDSGSNLETVLVTAVTGTTFTANYVLPHVGPVTIVDSTNQVLSRVITAVSLQWVRRLGLYPMDGSPLTESPLVQVVSYDERYDGNGGNRLFLKRRPIRTVSLLTVSGASITQAIGDAGGFVIDQEARSIAIRGGGTVLYGFAQGAYGRGATGTGARFLMGTQNVHVMYTAGYDQTPDDIVDAAIDMVALNYTRRLHIDESSQSKPDSIGAVRFRDWEVSPKILAVMDGYTRRAIV